MLEELGHQVDVVENGAAGGGRLRAHALRPDPDGRPHARDGRRHRHPPDPRRRPARGAGAGPAPDDRRAHRQRQRRRPQPLPGLRHGRLPDQADRRHPAALPPEPRDRAPAAARHRAAGDAVRGRARGAQHRRARCDVRRAHRPAAAGRRRRRERRPPRRRPQGAHARCLRWPTCRAAAPNSMRPLADGDGDAAGRLLHGLRGSAGYLGAAELYTLCGALEPRPTPAASTKCRRACPSCWTPCWRASRRPPPESHTQREICIISHLTILLGQK
jgi:hypothetical protein